MQIELVHYQQVFLLSSDLAANSTGRCMKRLSIYLSALALLAMVSHANAALIKVTNGPIYIDRGDGYTMVNESVQAAAGDVVMVTVGGSGEIVYDDGCRQPVEIGAVVVIGAVSPCGGAQPEPVDYSLVIGGLVVAGGVGAAVALGGGSDNDKPASQ